MYWIPVHKSVRKTSTTDCVRLRFGDAECSAEYATTESHKKDRKFSSRRHSFFRCSLSLAFFCVELKRERCLLNDFAVRQMMILFFFFRVLCTMQCCKYLVNFSTRECAAKGSVMTACNTPTGTLLCLTARILWTRGFLICEDHETLVKFINSDSFIKIIMLSSERIDVERD